MTDNTTTGEASTCACACHNPAFFQGHKEGHACCEHAQVLDNPPKATNIVTSTTGEWEWLNEALRHFYNRACSTAGASFAGDPYTILSKSAKAAIQAHFTTAVREAANKYAGQEHYIEAYGSTTGTGNKCACGKSFALLDSIKGHISWHLSKLAALQAEAQKEEKQ
jgi:hypothetical protein